MARKFHPAVIALVFLALAATTNAKEAQGKQISVGKTVGRMAAEAAVGVAPSLIGKATIRAGSISYATKAFGLVARGVIPSKAWRSAAVFTGTRISNYISAGLIPYASAGLMLYDGYTLVNWLLSDDE